MPEYQFKDAKFMPAREKQTVIRAWDRFLKNGCKKDHFTKALYHHLIQNCSFIAHYDLNGFYDTYFVEPEDTEHFLSQFDREKGCKSVEYGWVSWVKGGNDVSQEYYDINNAMVDVAAKYIAVLNGQARAEQEALDIKRAQMLLAKHGIKLDPPKEEVEIKDTTQPSMF